MNNAVTDVIKDVHPVEKTEAAVRKVGKLAKAKKLVPNKVSRVVAKQVLKGQKHSPELLFAGGIALGVATVVTACRSTLRLEDVLEENLTKQAMSKELARLDDGDGDYTEEDSKKDVAKLRVRAGVQVVHLYLPSIALGVASIACLTKAHNIQNNRIAGLTAAYTALDKGFQQYRARVVDELGVEKDLEFRYGKREIEVVTEEKNGPKSRKAVVHNTDGRSIYARVYDSATARNWEPNAMTNRTFIQCQQNWANDLLQSRGHLFLNEVYDMLGLERTKEGQVVGWTLHGDGDGYVDFNLFDPVNSERLYSFMNGDERSVLLDFNVDGPVLDKI